MKKEEMYRIVPTVWLRNDDKFYELVKVFDEYGVRELRINCARYNIESYTKEIIDFNNWCKINLGYEFKLLLDLPIPYRKIRIHYPNSGAGKYISQDEIIHIARDSHMCENIKNSVYTIDFDKIYTLEIGESLYVGDNLLEFVILEKMQDVIVLKCVSGGELANGKYITTNNVKYQRSTSEDIESYVNMCNIIEASVVAFSFVNNSDDIREIIDLESWRCNAKIISKIETEEGYNNVDEILNYSDMVMVARGDLLNNVGVGRFAECSSTIIECCEKVGADYYVATGILDSLKEKSGFVSRAELLDVYSLLIKKHAKLILTYGLCKNKEILKKVLSLIQDIKC